MKERVLSQENQRYSKDGLSSTKLESIRQRYLNVSSSVSLKDPGLVMCNELMKMIWWIFDDIPMNPHKIGPELWILLTQGPEVLKQHRNIPEYY